MTERLDFPRKHYETARICGIDSFPSVYSEVLAELALTLPVLSEENGGNVNFSIEELVSYHQIHYGAARSLTRQCISLSLSETGPGAEGSKLRSVVCGLNEFLPCVLESGHLSCPMPLGRIALPEGIEIPEGLSKHTESETVDSVRGFPDRSGMFLYPKENVRMSYMGDYDETERAVLRTLILDNPNVLPETPCQDLNYDAIRVSHGRNKESFLAIASEQQLEGLISLNTSETAAK